MADLIPCYTEGTLTNIGTFVTITVDNDAELVQLDPTEHRPLRQPAAAGTAP
jgi:hypothetical protein